jgi:predicted dehydrogenase
VTRLVLAGTGMIGHRHLGHILEHPDLELVGLVDPVPENRALTDVPGFSSIDEVNVAADGIVIATPTSTHAPMVIAAAKRGWHALVEKPVADSLEAADTMILAAEKYGIKVLVGHHRRHHPHVQKLKEIVNSGRLGQPVLASLMWAMRKPDDYFEVAWRAGPDGGPVKQNLIHDVDTLRFLFGEVSDVCGLGANGIRKCNRTESGAAVLSFESGVTAAITFSDAAPTPWGFEAGTGESPGIAETGQNYLHIACTQGAIEFPSLRIWTGAKTWNERPEPSVLSAEPGVPLVRQLEHFAEVIAGRAEPVVSARDARKTLDVILRIEAATFPSEPAR